MGRYDRLFKQKIELNKEDSAVIGTGIALAILQKKYSGRVYEWRMEANDAEKFLKKAKKDFDILKATMMSKMV